MEHLELEIQVWNSLHMYILVSAYNFSMSTDFCIYTWIINLTRKDSQISPILMNYTALQIHTQILYQHIEIDRDSSP